MDLDWHRFEELIKKNGIEIDRPKGKPHQKYKHRIYPLDYGYIKDTIGEDGEEIDVFVGQEGDGLTGAFTTEDSIKDEKEIKLLWNISYKEAKVAESFLNYGGMKAKLIWRGQLNPSSGIS